MAQIGSLLDEDDLFTSIGSSLHRHYHGFEVTLHHWEDCLVRASLRVLLVFERQGTDVRRESIIQFPLTGLSPTLLTRDFFPGWGAITSSPLRIGPEATLPQKPRKSRLGRNTYCTGKRKSFRLWSLSIGNGFEEVKQRSTVVLTERAPFSTTLSRRQAQKKRDASYIGDAQRSDKLRTRLQFLETVFGEVHQVHLINGKHHTAQQRYKESMTACLRDDTRCGHDQNIVRFGGRAAHDVTRICLCPGNGNDEFTIIRGESSDRPRQ